MNFTTETIDKLFLELSQFTQAKTKTELALKYRLSEIRTTLLSVDLVMTADDAIKKCIELSRGDE